MSLNSFIVGLRMEKTLQQEKQETEYKNPNDDQGGIHRRLRDRDLLRKRKAETEEKDQWVLGEERQRKRSRADEKSGTKRRGRPKKSEPTLEIPVSQDEVVPGSVGVVSEQTSGSLTPSLTAGGDKPESQPFPAASSSIPVLEPVLTSLYAPLLTSPAPVNQSPALLSLSVPAPLPTSVVDADLGPDEEEDLSLLQDKTADEDLTEPPSINIPEQDKIFSIPTLSSQPPPEYLPGNYSNL
ncbi:hemogen isoform X3 [Hippoglossus hippoglossus]|uniref:hemogen isoform X3 n=1 Tax=Hippoglossus hippoglossus TaxID=8267 RepID=UPI00148CE3E1|nr:hemogen isoform X3 [Hippoglossus hippoglossus]